MTAANTSVSTNSLQAVQNQGTWSGYAGDHITLSASVGVVTQNANGTWSWSYTPPTGATTQGVTIYANNGEAGLYNTGSVTFNLIINGQSGAASNIFTLVGIPDTQNYTSSDAAHGDTTGCGGSNQDFIDQAQWVADNANNPNLNIKFVTQYGDFTQDGDQDWEWQNGLQAMNIIANAGIPYNVCVGNHDEPYAGDEGEAYDPNFTNYVKYWGENALVNPDDPTSGYRFRNSDGSFLNWYGGSSPSGKSNFQTIQVGDLTLLHIDLEIQASGPELAWAKRVEQPPELSHLDFHP